MIDTRKVIYISDLNPDHEPFDTYREQREYDKHLKDLLSDTRFYLKGKRLDATTFDNYFFLYDTADRLVFKSKDAKIFCDHYFGFYAIKKDGLCSDDPESDCLKYRINEDKMSWQCDE